MALFDKHVDPVVPPQYSGFRGCLQMKAPVALWVNYAVTIAVEASKCYRGFLVRILPTYTCRVVVLALMVISAFKSCSPML